MSTIWTPGGERPVGRAEPSPRAPQSPPQPSEPPPGSGMDDEEAAVHQRMEELREQLAATPVEDVVAQFAYQLFEVAALHLSLQPPQLTQARTAIDAMAALADGMAGRLGQHEAPLREGLTQLQLTFVQVKKATPGQPAADQGGTAP